jgi:Flp pilus assembly protein TadD
MTRQLRPIRKAIVVMLIVFAGQISIGCEAQQPLESLSSQTSASPNSPLNGAEALIAQSDFKDAQMLLESYLPLHPGSADARFLLAYSLLHLSKPEASLAEYTRAAALRTPSAVDLKHVAQDYILLSDDADADKWMTRALQMDEDNADLWYWLGRIRYTRQNFASAIQCFQRALQLDPKNAKIEDRLGLAFEAMNRDGDAVTAYRTAIDWEKNSPHPSEEPTLNLATILLNSGQLPQAEPLLRQAVLIAPKDSKIHEKLGDLLAKEERLDEARVEYQEAIAISPDDSALHYLLAQIYKREDLKNEADIEFARASALLGTKATRPQ